MTCWFCTVQYRYYLACSYCPAVLLHIVMSFNLSIRINIVKSCHKIMGVVIKRRRSKLINRSVFSFYDTCMCVQPSVTSRVYSSQGFAIFRERYTLHSKRGPGNFQVVSPPISPNFSTFPEFSYFSVCS
jgi:hypothetical protein